MSESRWIGPDDSLQPGMTGFLVQKTHDTDGWERFEVRDTPAYTNQSCEPRLYGWCGTYNNLATYGCGVVRVERVARNGRAFVKELRDANALAVLEELGYPELAKEVTGEE